MTVQDFQKSSPELVQFYQTLKTAACDINHLKALSGPERTLCKKVAEFVNSDSSSPLQLDSAEQSLIQEISKKVCLDVQNEPHGPFHFMMSFFKGIGNLTPFRISSKSLQELLLRGPTLTQTAPPASDNVPIEPPTPPLPNKETPNFDSYLQHLPLSSEVKEYLRTASFQEKLLVLVDVLNYEMSASYAIEESENSLEDVAFIYEAIHQLAVVSSDLPTSGNSPDVVVKATVDATLYRTINNLRFVIWNNRDAWPKLDEAFLAFTRDKWPDPYVESSTGYSLVYVPEDLEKFFQHLRGPLTSFALEIGSDPTQLRVNLTTHDIRAEPIPSNTFQFGEFRELTRDTLFEAVKAHELANVIGDDLLAQLEWALDSTSIASQVQIASFYDLPIEGSKLPVYDKARWKNDKADLQKQFKSGILKTSGVKMMLIALSIHPTKNRKPLKHETMPISDMHEQRNSYIQFSPDGKYFRLGKFPQDANREKLIVARKQKDPTSLAIRLFPR